MDISSPARSLAPSLHVEVLTKLAGTSLPLTGRQIHRLLEDRASHGGVRKVLTQLVSSGLVNLTEAGSANLYTLNRDHVATEAVLALVDLRGRLFDRIRDAMAAWTHPPIAAAVFGSAARGDGDGASDVDLFVVRPAKVKSDDTAWGRDLADLNASIKRWSGNAGSIIDASPAQVTSMIARREAIVSELRRDQVVLVGTDVLKAGKGTR